ncbi:MAG TPA: Rpn family recombination-promoting nuclease/putative transposase [Candidatus Megaira endosymbiont of Nemacystus decipiens]|nr:Rpn family recombination-promoting nuclease/putative transposase [Candidatus Megaera endosymbiont of Nemacystus decipiens]
MHYLKALFTDPAMAKELLIKNYKLIDLQSMSDQEIK